jgi:hypothetical protein
VAHGSALERLCGRIGSGVRLPPEQPEERRRRSDLRVAAGEHMTTRTNELLAEYVLRQVEASPIP